MRVHGAMSHVRYCKAWQLGKPGHQQASAWMACRSKGMEAQSVSSMNLGHHRRDVSLTWVQAAEPHGWVLSALWVLPLRGGWSTGLAFYLCNLLCDQSISPWRIGSAYQGLSTYTPDPAPGHSRTHVAGSPLSCHCSCLPPALVASLSHQTGVTGTRFAFLLEANSTASQDTRTGCQMRKDRVPRETGSGWRRAVFAAPRQGTLARKKWTSARRGKERKGLGSKAARVVGTVPTAGSVDQTGQPLIHQALGSIVSSQPRPRLGLSSTALSKS